MRGWVTRCAEIWRTTQNQGFVDPKGGAVCSTSCPCLSTPLAFPALNLGSLHTHPSKHPGVGQQELAELAHLFTKAYPSTALACAMFLPWQTLSLPLLTPP